MSFLLSPYHISMHGRAMSWTYGGSISGFVAGGGNHHDAWCGGCGTGIWYAFNDIWSISLTSDGNAVDSGGSNLKNGHMGGAVSGGTHSYNAAGGGIAGATSDQIERFANTNPGAGSSDVGNLTSNLLRGVGVSSIGNGHGYFVNNTNVQKYNLASSADANSVATLSNDHGDYVQNSASDGSANYGYVAGGSAPAITGISRFSFDNEATNNDVGDLGSPYNGQGECGGSSETNGYVFGHGNIYRYAFANSSSGSDVGNLLNSSTSRGTGFSSTTHSYASGGGVHETHMEKFAHASHATSSFVGSLGTGQTTNRTGHVSTHY